MNIWNSMCVSGVWVIHPLLVWAYFLTHTHSILTEITSENMQVFTLCNSTNIINKAVIPCLKSITYFKNQFERRSLKISVC